MTETTAAIVTEPRRSPQHWVKFRGVWDGGYRTKAEAQGRVAALVKLEIADGQ